MPKIERGNRNIWFFYFSLSVCVCLIFVLFDVKQFPYIYYVCYLFFFLFAIHPIAIVPFGKIIFDVGLYFYLIHSKTHTFAIDHRRIERGSWFVCMINRPTHTHTQHKWNGEKCVLISKRFIVPSGYCFIIKFIFLPLLTNSTVCMCAKECNFHSFDLLLQRFRQFYCCHFVRRLPFFHPLIAPKIRHTTQQSIRKKFLTQNARP